MRVSASQFGVCFALPLPVNACFGRRADGLREPASTIESGGGTAAVAANRLPSSMAAPSLVASIGPANRGEAAEQGERAHDADGAFCARFPVRLLFK